MDLAIFIFLLGTPDLLLAQYIAVGVTQTRTHRAKMREDRGVQVQDGNVAADEASCTACTHEQSATT